MSEGHHIIPAKIYIRTLVALVILTIITVAVSRVDLGSNLNIIVAMIVAGIKATIVSMFFMGLRYDRPLNSVVYLCGIAFLMFLFVLSFVDLMTRDEIDPQKSRSTDNQQTIILDDYKPLPSNLEEEYKIK